MANRTPNVDASTDQLKSDLEHLTHTLEELVNATADDSRSNIKEMRERAEQRLKDTRTHLEARGEQLYSNARDNVREQADVCDKYVHDNPWTSIGIGAGIGVVIGMLIGRR
ncbi:MULTISPECIES: DUF883 family protein [Halomonadaceae]|jgi:ElaB/YqjD/DUF883 family membrane-anchored ribosome-binding protein|uniref:DUF883 family protein n=1 Tax=Halomonadaceae TaxID=28256 RepID=UPI001582A6D1|nr:MULTISPECIES: DUF883 family protein [Halomonas]MDI4637378.1 DUF883 family protein [Halomonas sp. BMC7]NUJ61213.1 DUF883 domain-containing protein [Halomonas taeanensis]|tara:strand:- start:586 stop:918 length:333 start_codon:yes stop_codon:yes gene_type:complete